MKNKVLKMPNPVQPEINKRRQFLKLSGMVVVGSGLLMACSNDDDSSTPPDPNVFDLGAGNLGILNYAYALEQLEAAFYQNVLDGSYWAGAPANEKQILEDLYNHEVIHREFFRTAITAVAPNDITPDLEFDFSSVDFSSRDSVLGTSKVLEDTGVGAYNGAGKLINANDAAGAAYLTLAGKIVSVEARHASAIRNLLSPGTGSFAGDDILVGIGTPPAFDKAVSPSDTLSAVASTNFVVTPFTANNLPTS
ncbi:MAG: ferritin-like domain-containing protein [Gelidibacter sp.]